jgi:phage terminase large subunit-like protein
MFDLLKLADVPGNPSLKEAAGDWFRDIVRALHGSWDPITRERWIREVFALVPKKNAKTSYGAGLMLTSLLMNERPMAKFLLVAPTQDVTELAFSQVAGMVRLEKRLIGAHKGDGLLRVQDHIKLITHRDTGATLEVMSFDPEVLTGQRPTGFMLDELHVVSGSSKAASAVGQLRGGMISQPEAFGLFITTQSEKPPAGVFKAELQKARAIRDGRAEGRTLPVLYEFPEDIANDRIAWRDPRHWPMVTPNAGRSITIERLVEELATADLLGEEEVRRWATQHLNVEIGLALRSDAWAGAEFWERRGGGPATLADLIARCDVAVVGIDGGGLDDLLGLAVLGRERISRRWLHWGHAWAHECVLQRRKEIAPRLRDFERDDHLTIVTDDSDADVQGVADAVEMLSDAGLLPARKAIGVDPVGVSDIVDELERRGFGTDAETGQISGIRQGFTLQTAIKVAERRLAAGTMVHGGSALMAWSVGNAKVEMKGNGIMITKQAAGTAKIDPVMALMNAVTLMSENPEAAGQRGRVDDFLRAPLVA